MLLTVSTPDFTNYNSTGKELRQYSRANKVSNMLIIDLDGTIRDVSHRNHLLPTQHTLDTFAPNYNDAFNNHQLASVDDTPKAGNIHAIRMMQDSIGVRTVILSTSTGSVELNTIPIVKEQLKSWDIDYDIIIMRHPTDQRTPAEQKLWVLDLFNFPYPEVVVAIDDCDVICKAFRDSGYTVLQVK